MSWLKLTSEIACGAWKHLRKLHKQIALVTAIAIFGIFLIHALYVKQMKVLSLAPTMSLIDLNSQTNQTMLQDNGRIKTQTFELPIHFSTYSTASGKLAFIEQSLIPWRTNNTLQRMPRKNIFELDSVGNLITSDFHRSHLITITLMGRLGNNMFQLAALLSCAKRLNYTPIAALGGTIFSYFIINVSNHMNVINSKIFYEKSYGTYSKDIENLDTNSNWTLSGYFQSWKYFDNDENFIRRSFKFRPIIYEPAHQFVEKYRSQNKTIIGIHVRRGDMVYTAHDVGYAVAPKKYLINSMNYFRHKYNETFFLVSSDDIPWCKENFRGHNDTDFSYFDNTGTDMAMLSCCDHVIITSGTFGWWGAMLAGGDVVYFKGYPRPGSIIDKGMNRKDYYPHHWVGME